MIQNAKALQGDRLPETMHHREGKITQLSNALDPIIEGYPGIDTLVTGPPGSGKTTTVRFVLDRLSRKTFDYESGMVNCISDSTKSAALHALLRDAGMGGDLRLEGTSPSVYLDRLRDVDELFIAVIDEAHSLNDPELLHSLYDIEHVTLILITLKETEFFAGLDPQVSSRLQGAKTVFLEPYHDHEIVDILEPRAEAALGREHDASAKLLQQIAEEANGDARHAIALLRRACRRADSENSANVSLEHLDADVRAKAQKEVRDRYLSQFDTHQRTLFDIVAEFGPIRASELHERYEERVSDPRPKSTRRDDVATLKGYEMIESEGAGRGTTYRLGRFGRIQKIA
jgi:Cdc6-like AAA superfamily ATPase